MKQVLLHKEKGKESHGHRHGQGHGHSHGASISSAFDQVRCNQPGVTFSHKDLFLRDSEQNTPLSLCLRSYKDGRTGYAHSLEALWKANAASSVFVRGYAPKSLICTLPMAVQPPSSVFEHPSPIEIPSEVISDIDSHLAEYVEELYTLKQLEKFEKDRKEHILKCLYPDESSVEHKLLHILMQSQEGRLTSTELLNIHNGKFSEHLKSKELKDILLATKAVKYEEEEGKRYFSFSYLCDNEKCTHIPSGDSVRVVSVEPTDSSEYIIEFDGGATKQVSLENLKPLEITEKKEGIGSTSVPFSHSGCAAMRPITKASPAGIKTWPCLACGGHFAVCSGSYGCRNQTSGQWRHGVCQSPDECPQSPNAKYCTELCEKHVESANVPKPSLPHARKKEGKAFFRVGDKVMLNGDKEVAGKSSLCLSFAVEKRVGVIVKIEKSRIHQSNDQVDYSLGVYNPSHRSHGRGGNRGGGGGGYYNAGGFSGAYRGAPVSNPNTSNENVTVHVMALHSGQIDAYSSNMLQYVDGSSLKVLPEVSGEISIKIPNGIVKTVTESTRTRQFENGDRVKLHINSFDKNGCLGDPSFQWVGVVNSHHHDVTVTCHSNSVKRDPSINFPNHSYSPHCLLLENEYELGGVQPLMTGDRVNLADDFDENDGDG